MKIRSSAAFGLIIHRLSKDAICDLKVGMEIDIPKLEFKNLESQFVTSSWID